MYRDLITSLNDACFSSRLRKLPERFFDVPEQVLKFALFGIEPVTLATIIGDEDICTAKK